MLSWQWLTAITAGAFGASWVGTWGALFILRRRGMLDHPNARSSHLTPTPTGGGIAAITVMGIAWMLVAIFGPEEWGADVGAAAAAVSLGTALAVLSLMDDLRGGLSPGLRFAFQAMAVLGGLIAIPGQVFQGLLPPFVDSVAVVFIWLWFINLFNFMDGIDGIAGVQATGIGVGVAVVASVGALAPAHMIFGMVAAASALGFLLWNWHPAKIFMGDVGSVGFGYLLGWLLLVLAASGEWAAALILPMYFVADATITLMRRAFARQTLWQAHRDHFYQRAATAAFGNHRTVTRTFLAAQVGLVALAGVVAVAPGVRVSGILTAAALVAALLWYLRRLATR